MHATSHRSPLRRLLTALVLTWLSACSCVPSTTPARRAFYSWKTTLDLTAAERSALTDLHVDRLYLHYLDVDLGPDGNPAFTKLTVRSPDTAHTEVVPVVFLRNRIFRGLRSDELHALADRIWQQIERTSSALHVTPREVSFDCDWTETTRDAYFEFLRQLHALAAPQHAILSATIRLHQVKFHERTGVPPVERGMLMFYNMGVIGPEATDHAIFDPEAAGKYLARVAAYPLPLDVALPIWAWTVQVRDGQVVNLLQSTDPATLASLDFLKPAGPLRWSVTRPTFMDGTFVREGDVLQGDSIDPATALTAANQLAAVLPPRVDRTVALFELSERNLARHDRPSLDRLFNAVR